MEFAQRLRMRQDNIKRVTTLGKETPFETFQDSCSTYIYIPAVVEQAGTIEFTINHPYQ